ncbi:hypothetical protein WICPIJ_003675 [Wickerhamomyces pijperi]|uniref:Uncharacterized protein n=1 Tax=Wickerhamomyces pijperi TaxID=599730 RepID=A0A9P8TMS2_WICPI|nr:hypothetical protein WICPIJ_003675 [Wickerhamomyces pijperi]
MTPGMFITWERRSLIWSSSLSFKLRSNRLADDLINGIADPKIITAMNSEEIGSKIGVLNTWIRIVDTTTPKEPNVSARMCRKIPLMFSLSSSPSQSPPPPWE